MKDNIRRFFQVGAAITVMLLGSIGVQAEEAGSSAVVRVNDDPRNINPLYVTDLNSFAIMQSIYAPFFEIVDGEVYYGNGLLESVEANADSTVFTLKLKEGLTWHDGEAISADDIVFTMEVLVDPEQAVPYSSYGFIDDEAAVTEKVDERTATITFSSSNTGFLGSLSQIYLIPKHIYEGVSKIGESELNYEPVGNGPYKFVSYDSGQSYVVEKFDGYFEDNSKSLDSIVFKIIKDDNTAIAALQSGEVDVMTISSDQHPTVEALDSVTIYPYNSGQVNALGMNLLTEPLNDVKVRQAISYALNTEELITFAWSGLDYAEPAYSIFTPDTLYYDDSLTHYDNDTAKAKELLAEAGVSSLDLSLMYSSSSDWAEKAALYIQSKLAGVGINVTLNPQADTVFANAVQEENSTKYNLVLNNWELGAEPSLYADIITIGSRSNYAHVADEELDALWTKGLVTPDGEERAAIYSEIQNTINDQQYLHPLSYSNGFYAISNELTGFDDFLLQTIYLDYSRLQLAE